MKKKMLLVAVLAALAWAPARASASAEIADELRAVPQGELSSMLIESLSAYDGVSDYKAVFEKRERDGDALGPTEKIYFKFEKPFKLFMNWLNSNKKGLQLVYERGRNNNKLAIHKPGLALGLLPVIFLDQSSPYVREGSKTFDIEDAGIGTFLHDFSKMVARAAREGKIKVLGRRTEGSELLFDVEFPGSAEDDDYFAERVVAGFDADTRLPVHMELYGWDGKEIGVYDYKELRLNVGRDDADFKKQIDRHLLRVYAPRPPKAARPRRTEGFSK